MIGSWLVVDGEGDELTPETKPSPPQPAPSLPALEENTPTPAVPQKVIYAGNSARRTETRACTTTRQAPSTTWSDSPIENSIVR